MPKQEVVYQCDKACLKKFLVLLSLFALYTSLTAFVVAQVEHPDEVGEVVTNLVKKVSPAVVIVYTYDSQGNAVGQGTGFFVSVDGAIITNYHVLKGASSAKIKTATGNTIKVRGIVAEDKENDLVKITIDEFRYKIYEILKKRGLLTDSGGLKPILRPSRDRSKQLRQSRDVLAPSSDIEEITIPIVTLAKEDIEVGQRVLVIGGPLGLEGTVSDGIISAVRDIPVYGKIIQMTVPVSPGSSGSPVFNMKGEVVGIATLMLKEGQNLNFAIPSSKIEAIKPGKEVPFSEWATGNLEAWLTSAEGLYWRGFTEYLYENYVTALIYFQESVKQNSKNADAHFYIGFCYDKLGRYQEAIEAYKQAISIKPDYAEAHNNMGNAYVQLGRYQEAIEAYKQAIRINPDDAEARYNMGVVYGNLGRYQEAIEAYKQAISIKPDFAMAYNNMGVAYGKLGRYQDEIEAFKQAIRIKPDFAMAHYNMGAFYGNLGRYQEAIEAFKQAIRINPDDAKAHYNMGLTYLSLGDRGGALDEYKILKDLDKDWANKLFNLIYE